MKTEYEAMLDEVVENLPEERVTEARFSVPNPRILYEGKRTIIPNFKDITSAMERDPSLLSTFISKEAAAPSSYEEPRLIIQTRVDQRSFSNILDKFIDDYVICPACGGPDTKLSRKGRIHTLQCDICGTESSVEAI